MMKGARAIDGLGLLVGMIVGAGMFALPYVVSRAGLFWGGFYLLFGAVVVSVLHTLYGEVVYVIKERHRLPGYARLCLGKHAGQLAAFAIIFGFFGSLLAYGILAGIFARQLLGIGTPWAFSVAFFIIAPVFLLFDMKRVGWMNLWLTIPLLAFVAFLGIVAFPQVGASNFQFADNAHWFLPYGVILFSLGGAAAIPEVADIMRRREGRLFERIVLFGMLIPVLTYVIFVLSVVGVSGAGTSEDAIAGLLPFLGGGIVRLGALIGFLAVFTSYLALGLDLRSTFHFDYNFGLPRAWLLVLSVPLLLFLFGVSNLIDIIGVVGGVMVGIDGILILLLALYVRKHYKHPKGFIPIGKMVPYILIIVFAVGVVWQLGAAFGLV